MRGFSMRTELTLLLIFVTLAFGIAMLADRGLL
jgi:hypothetical protein